LTLSKDDEKRAQPTAEWTIGRRVLSRICDRRLVYLEVFAGRASCGVQLARRHDGREPDRQGYVGIARIARRLTQYELLTIKDMGGKRQQWRVVTEVMNHHERRERVRDAAYVVVEAPQTLAGKLK